MPYDAPGSRCGGGDLHSLRARYDTDVVISGGPNHEMDRFPKAGGLSMDSVDHHLVRYTAASRGFPPDRDAQDSGAAHDDPSSHTARIPGSFQPDA